MPERHLYAVPDDVGPWTWGDELADIVEVTADTRRHNQGLQLWAGGAVENLGGQRRSFTATVRDISRRPHRTEVVIDALERSEVRAILAILRDDPNLCGDLLGTGDGQAAVAELDERASDLGVALGPEGCLQLDTYCDCTDHCELCQHGVALLNAVAELIDARPAEWLLARGVPLAAAPSLAQSPAQSPGLSPVAPPPRPGEEPLASRLDDFWQGSLPARVLPIGLRPRPASAERSTDELRAALHPDTSAAADVLALYEEMVR